VGLSTQAMLDPDQAPEPTVEVVTVFGNSTVAVTARVSFRQACVS